MIKKLLTSVLCISAIYPSITLASLDKYYFGGDVQTISLKPENFSSQSNMRGGISGFFGYRWGVAALELGITGIQSQNYNYYNSGNQLTYTGHSRAFNVSVDALFFKSIANNLELKGLLGSGMLDTKTTMYVNNASNLQVYSSSSTALNIGARFGAGLQYNLTRNCSTSLMYKFQATSESFSNMQTVALSLAYMF